MSYSSARTLSCFGHVDWENMKPDWENIQNKPDCFPPCEHQHSWEDIIDRPDGSGLGKLLSGPQITLEPADGDLLKGDVKITATGHTSPGVSVVYEPIFMDMQTPYQKKGWKQEPVDDPREAWWLWDCMGSEGLKDADNDFPYSFIIEETPYVEVPEMPAEANAFFYEIYWKTTHASNPVNQQLHPCYNLDTPVETFMECKNITDIKGAKFVSGKETSMHDNAFISLTHKLSPTTTQWDTVSQTARHTKLNFATRNPGEKVEIKTTVRLLVYNYSAMWGSLGRIKIIPVQTSDQALAIKSIKPFLEEGDLGSSGQHYKLNEKDIVRMQGCDLRQAVDQLSSAIGLAIASGAGDQATLSGLQSRLNTEILEGDGDFGTIRNKLTAIKAEAASAGALKLTKLERDRGVIWEKPGNPKT